MRKGRKEGRRGRKEGEEGDRPLSRSVVGCCWGWSVWGTSEVCVAGSGDVCSEFVGGFLHSRVVCSEGGGRGSHFPSGVGFFRMGIGGFLSGLVLASSRCL